jgi:hypothetical protein
MVATLLFLACDASPTPSPTEGAAWSLRTGEGSSVLKVTDNTGLICAVGAARLGPVMPGEYAAEALPDERLINIRWFGGACDASTLNLTGSAEHLRMVLIVHQGMSIPPGSDCPAVGVFHGVSLALIQPVQQEAVLLTFNDIPN